MDGVLPRRVEDDTRSRTQRIRSSAPQVQSPVQVLRVELVARRFQGKRAGVAECHLRWALAGELGISLDIEGQPLIATEHAHVSCRNCETLRPVLKSQNRLWCGSGVTPVKGASACHCEVDLAGDRSAEAGRRHFNCGAGGRRGRRKAKAYNGRFLQSSSSSGLSLGVEVEQLG